MSTRIRELQSELNAETRENWEYFAGHRSAITQLVRAACNKESVELCVLGAGNCNDLELHELLVHFRWIELLDIDPEAVTAGVKRQSVAAKRLVLHGGIDVTGIADQISAWSPTKPPNSAEFELCLAKARRARIKLRRRFHVTASVCLLSQLIDAIVATLGKADERFLELLTVVRRRHMWSLLKLTKSGGTAFLITDVVSSVTCPQLLSASDWQLPQVVAQAINARNFFHGVNPFVLKAQFETDPELTPMVRAVHLTNPWLWNLGSHSYAVCAVVVQRA